jgi:hypothetical protein
MTNFGHCQNTANCCSRANSSNPNIKNPVILFAGFFLFARLTILAFTSKNMFSAYPNASELTILELIFVSFGCI